MGNFFRLPQYNVFDYKPRFYDPEKERRKELLNELRKSQGKRLIGEEDGEYKPGSTIKGSFKSKMTRTSFSAKNSIFRVVVIAAILMFLAYLLFIADLTSFVKLFAK